MEKVGIGNIQIIVGFGLSMAKELQKGLEDGKLQFGEIIGFADNLASIPNVVQAVQKAPAEFLDLTAQEQEQLKKFVQDGFDIENNKVELAIEESFYFALSGVRYATTMARIFTKKAA